MGNGAVNAGAGIRVTVRSREKNERLLAAFKDYGKKVEKQGKEEVTLLNGSRQRSCQKVRP